MQVSPGVRSTFAVAALVCLVDPVRAADPPPTKPFQFASDDFRHSGRIIDAALSPDGKLVATACSRDVMVWDVETGKRLNWFFDCGVPPYAMAVNTARIAFSPDSRWLAHCVHTDVAARVWDLKTGREVRTYGANLPATSPAWRRTWVEFTPDGANVTVIRLHDIEHFAIESGKPSQRLNFSEKSFDLLATTPDGRTIAGNTGDRTNMKQKQGEVTIVDTATGKTVVRLPLDAQHAGFGPKGQTLATVDRERIRVWEVKTGDELASISRPAKADADLCTDPAFSPDGKTIYIGCRDGTIRRFDWRAGQELPPFGKHVHSVTKVLPLPDGKRVLSVGMDRAIRRWDVATGKEIALPGGYIGRIFRATWPEGDRVAVADWSGRIDVWNGDGSKVLRTIQASGSPVGGLAVSPDDGSLASFHWDGRVRIWDPVAGKEVRSMRVRPPFTDDPQFFLFGPRGRVYLNSDFKNVQAWDVGTSEPVWPEAIESYRLAHSPDWRTLAVTDFAATTIRLIDPFSPQPAVVMTPSGPKSNPAVCHGLAFVTDRLLVSAHDDGSVRFWDTRLRRETKVVRREGGYVEKLYIAPTGDWLISRSRGEWVVWDCRTGTAVDSFSSLLTRTKANGVEVGDFANRSDHTTFLCADWLGRIRPPENMRWAKGEAAWNALAGEDSIAAYGATCALIGDPAGAARLFKSHVQLVAGERPEEIDGLIQQLDAPKFADREAAAKALAALGPLARPAMSDALRTRTQVEVRDRLRKLLDLPVPERTNDEVRIGRAIQILETAATAETRAVLGEWAKGARGAFQTEAARQAVERLDRAGQKK